MSDANWMTDAVREFHVAMGQPAPEKYAPLTTERAQLRLRLICEELEELADALGFFLITNPDGGQLTAIRETDDVDEVGAIDALQDIKYVVLGQEVEMGLPGQRFFAEVHRSNMTKVGGPVRADGKILKPDTYEPPRIAYLLDRLKERQR